jgi:FHA domain-containing protein
VVQTLERERAAALDGLRAAYAAELLSAATLEERVAAVLRADEPQGWLWDLPRSARRPPPGPRALIVVEDGHTIARLRLRDPATRLIGRDPAAWLHLDDTSVSRRHALISRRGGACRIRDLGSTNGTLLNGVPVTVADVRRGDELRLGETLIAVR